MVCRVFLITLVGTSLLVAACGNDDSPESANTNAGTTGTTDPTSQIPDIPEFPSAGDGRGGSGDSGSSQNSGGDGSRGGDGSPGRDGSSGEDRSRGGGDGQPGFSPPGISPSPPGGGSPNAGEAPPVGSDAAARSLAREICANVTLEGIALNLRITRKKRDSEFVARAFSRRYPKEHRDAAYRGCLEGFRNPAKR